MNKIIIKKASHKDLPCLRKLEQALVDAERPFSTSIKDKDVIYYDLEKLIRSDTSYVLVAVDNGVIIGSGYVDIRQSKVYATHEQHGYLGFMYVEPEYRGKGLNKKIMDGLIVWCKGKGIDDFYLHVYQKNEPAIRAYEKMGFTPSLVEMKLNTKNK